MKLLLYCTKAKPYFFYHYLLNGTIVAECDFEVEKIEPYKHWNCEDDYDIHYDTNKLHYDELLEKSCLNNQELDDYLEGWDGYAIHIKNLHIFDEPKELSDYCFTEKSYNDINKIFTDEIMIDGKWYRPVNKAPQNMMRVKRVLQDDGILISIQPQWLCKILNGEKTIEVRKKVLKGMLK